MTIKYNLSQNKLTQEECYAARVQLSGSADLNDIVARIVNQGTTVRPPDILAVLENAVEAANALLLEGMRVNLGGLVDLFPKISGKFTGPTDGYDPARHQVDVAATPGVRVRDTVRANAVVQKEETIKPVPVLLRFQDLLSNTTNDKVTSGGVITIDGNRLRVHPAADDEGLYLIAADGQEFKIINLQKNSPGQIVAQTCALPAGMGYHVEVRTRYTDEGELRIGRLDYALTAIVPE
jgi:hypothetical protein